MQIQSYKQPYSLVRDYSRNSCGKYSSPQIGHKALLLGSPCLLNTLRLQDLKIDQWSPLNKKITQAGHLQGWAHPANGRRPPAFAGRETQQEGSCQRAFPCSWLSCFPHLLPTSGEGVPVISFEGSVWCCLDTAWSKFLWRLLVAEGSIQLPRLWWRCSASQVCHMEILRIYNYKC